ncbi:MAG: glycosyl transferase family 36 [Armatimonadetes bacterium]|nr:glycosyl transferase family 36 [Armatimonadota bacterium]
MSKYGEFSLDGKEYIMYRPDTPRPWINYLSNEKYCALCSQTGGGYSFYETSGYNRITKEYPPFVVYRDCPGRFVYLRDMETGEYWNINWQPVQKPYVNWESRHGLGYTRLKSEYSEIAGEITYFVPRRDDCEIWMVKVKNVGDRPRKLASFSTIEWSLANYAFNLIEASFAQLFNEVYFENDTIVVTTRFWNVAPIGTGNPNLRWDKYAFFTSNTKPVGFDCLEENFLGVYRGWERPIVVEQGQCTNSLGNGREIVGVLQHNFELQPGEEKRFLIILGVAPRKEDAFTTKERYDTWEEAEHALEEVKKYWEGYISHTWCETPDPDFCLSFNIWNKYQSWITSRWSRMDSYYIGGASIVGFRDSWQDMLGVLPNNPEWARQRALYIIEHQFPDGSTLHNWDPLTNIGVKTGHSDDPLWLVMGIVEYIKETGDLSFLDELAPYYDGGAETVRQHLIHALDYSLSRLSPRHISLMEAADWNDGLDHVGRQGRGESTMVSEHLVWMLKESSVILRAAGMEQLAEKYEKAADEIADAVNEHLWDGEWYVRGTRDDGQVFGSSKNPEGKIFLNAQSWAVMSGVAKGERALTCMQAVEKHLETQYGPVLFLPAYSEPNPKIGIITRFAPGTKENGTIFNHPVAWAVMAECILGRGDRAYDIWKRSSFIIRGKNPDVYKAEPYVYAEYVHGPDSQDFGLGEFTWMTGTAAWMWKVSLEWIMGVRPELEGLRIDPCIPSSWDRYSIKRTFRNAIYEIHVENPEHVNKGVKKIVVDGEEYPSNLIPAFQDGAVHHVYVTMGK